MLLCQAVLYSTVWSTKESMVTLLPCTCRSRWAWCVPRGPKERCPASGRGRWCPSRAGNSERYRFQPHRIWTGRNKEAKRRVLFVILCTEEMLPYRTDVYNVTVGASCDSFFSFFFIFNHMFGLIWLDNGRDKGESKMHQYTCNTLIFMLIKKCYYFLLTKTWFHEGVLKNGQICPNITKLTLCACFLARWDVVVPFLIQFLFKGPPLPHSLLRDIE